MIAAMAAHVRQLHKALAFAACTIKSGEPWSETCEEIVGGALAAVSLDDEKAPE